MSHDEWVLVPRDFLDELARRKDVRGEALRLFFHLMANMGVGNEIAVSATSVADALGVRRENVYRALRQLRRLGLVRDAGPGQPADVLYVSPDVCRKVGSRGPRATPPRHQPHPVAQPPPSPSRDRGAPPPAEAGSFRTEAGQAPGAVRAARSRSSGAVRRPRAGSGR
jgi:hypothetical protein